MAFAATTSAQSSMTDDQIMQFVVKEHNAGTSQAQIVTKLMQRGVNITQIRRVRDKYERQIQNKGMGVVADQAVERQTAACAQPTAKEEGCPGQEPDQHADTAGKQSAHRDRRRRADG